MTTRPRARGRTASATIERVLAIFRGRGIAGDTTGNSPGTKWTAFNAIAEHLDYGRRYTARTNQVQRSFEDTAQAAGAGLRRRRVTPGEQSGGAPLRAPPGSDSSEVLREAHLFVTGPLPPFA